MLQSCVYFVTMPIMSSSQPCIFIPFMVNVFIYRSLAIEPTVEAYHGLAALYFNIGKMEEAKRTFEQLLEMESDRVEAVCGYVSGDKHFVLPVILFRLDNITSSFEVQFLCLSVL